MIVTPLALVKQHLRYSFDDRDDFITNLVEAAEETVRNETGLAFYEGPIKTSITVPAPLGSEDAIMVHESQMRNPLRSGPYAPDGILTDAFERITISN